MWDGESSLFSGEAEGILLIGKSSFFKELNREDYFKSQGLISVFHRRSRYDDFN